VMTRGDVSPTCTLDGDSAYLCKRSTSRTEFLIYYLYYKLYTSRRGKFVLKIKTDSRYIMHWNTHYSDYPHGAEFFLEMLIDLKLVVKYPAFHWNRNLVFLFQRSTRTKPHPQSNEFIPRPFTLCSVESIIMLPSLLRLCFQSGLFMVYLFHPPSFFFWPFHSLLNTLTLFD